MLNDIVKNLLNEVSGLIPTTGAFNIRNNGQSEGRKSTENIDIVPKPNGAGLDIYVKPFTKNEDVHIPALITADGVHDVAYNDFHIGEGAEIKIIAGCGIHNCGCDDSIHEGIHRFFVGKNAKIIYEEKHIGDGDGNGKRIINPQTHIEAEENAYIEMDTVQLKGVDSTKRISSAKLADGATMIIKDAQGNTVYEATRFQGTSSNQNRRRAVPGFIPLYASDVFSDCCDNLVEGQTYYVTFSGTTYGGVTNTKMTDYMIVYDPAA